MLALPTEQQVLGRIVAWAERDHGVRALVLTSTRARPGGAVDALSDYDVIAVLADVGGFHPEAAYGTPLVRWGDEHLVHGVRTLFRGVVYDDYVKIDWTLWPDRVAALVGERGLTDALDVSYRVLLDRDGVTAGWPEPTYRAHVPSPPTEAEYVALVEEFWWGTTYAAKSLWRGELFFSEFVLDVDLTHGALRRLLEWRCELDHGWTLKPGAYGRGLEQLVPADVWAELTAVDGAATSAEGWQSLHRLCALFRRVATEVGASLGYPYPQHVDEAISARLEQVRLLRR